MHYVQGFPRCEETLSGKFIWNEDDPVNGINVPIWKQLEFDVECTEDSDCDRQCRDNFNKAEYVPTKFGKKKCYAYKVNYKIYTLGTEECLFGGRV